MYGELTMFNERLSNGTPCMLTFMKHYWDGEGEFDDYIKAKQEFRPDFEGFKSLCEERKDLTPDAAAYIHMFGRDGKWYNLTLYKNEEENYYWAKEYDANFELSEYEVQFTETKYIDLDINESK